jgi:phospholipid N-methyltransferase
MLSPEVLYQNKCKFLHENFFNLCNNATVLEVGCFDGFITEHIAQHRPAHLVLLEAAAHPVAQVAEKFPQATVIHGDMHKDMIKVGSVDVAIVLGVIYHSPAPLYVLEEIINHCSPQHIVIDNMSPVFQWQLEEANQPGMRYMINQTKSCNIVINIDNELLIKAFDNLGYKLAKQLQYPPDARSANLPIFHFIRVCK